MHNTHTQRGGKKAAKEYTMEEVRAHNTEQDAWVVMYDNVYDVTKWIPRHPGMSSLCV
jgi:L-lactate dehydrogenase (cytochrome)